MEQSELYVANGSVRNGFPIYKVFSKVTESVERMVYRTYAELHHGDIVFMGATMPFNVPRRLGAVPARKSEYVGKILKAFCEREKGKIEDRTQRRMQLRESLYQNEIQRGILA